MNYINKIKRIVALEKALKRAYAYTNKHEESNIDFDIEDKIELLKKDLKSYYDRENKNGRKARRDQLRTASRLLKVDFYDIMR